MALLAFPDNGAYSEVPSIFTDHNNDVVIIVNVALFERYGNLVRGLAEKIASANVSHHHLIGRARTHIEIPEQLSLNDVGYELVIGLINGLKFLLCHRQ